MTNERREYSIHRRGRKYGVVVYVWTVGRGTDCGMNYDLGTFRTRREAEETISADQANHS